MLDEFGGAEQVLKAFIDVFPDFELFTGFYNPKIVYRYFPELNKHNLHTTLAQGTALEIHGPTFQALSPLLWRQFSFRSFDFILSNSSYICANLVNAFGKKHVQYILSVPKNVFQLDPKAPLQKIFPYHLYLQPYYKRVVRSSPYIITISEHTKKIIDSLFQISSTVIYPPADIPKYIPPKKTNGDYFLCVSRLDPSKNLELPILACTKLGLPLKIVGGGRVPKYETYLRSLAGHTVEFLGPKTSGDAREMNALHKNAKAFLLSSKSEDFGIAPVEAMGRGLPVIAYHGGGPKETVIPGKTGMFFYEHTPESLMEILRQFNPNNFSVDVLYRHARKFRKEIFKKKLDTYITGALRTSSVA